jgi:hypothetical protein
MFETAIARLSLAVWLGLGASNAATGGSAPPIQPMPFEFGPDWRWAPPSEQSPAPGRRRDRAEPSPSPQSNRSETWPHRSLAPRGIPSRPESDERADALRRAMAPRSDPAVLRREKLDKLLGRLAIEQDAPIATRISQAIEAMWEHSGSETADLLMERASGAMKNGRVPLALELLDRIVLVAPDWIEAWNRRATARLRAGNVDGAMADIDHVLKLEPRHFGALATMGTILEQTGFEERALDVFRRVQQIFPLLPSLQEHIDRLEIGVEGRAI